MKKNSVLRRIGAAGLATALVLAMGVTAFADDATTVSTDGSATINKTLTMAASGVSVPSATFNFSVTAVTTGAPTVGNVSIAASDAMKNTSAATSAIFANVDLTNVTPGQYEYTVTESAATFTGDANHVLTTDTAEYKVVIRVENTSSGKAITGITAQKKNADGSYGDKLSAIGFTNKYTEYANDDGTGTNPENNGLVISKSITGTGANTSATFKYSIVFTEDSVNSGLATTVTSGSLYTDQACTAAATSITAGTTYYFQLTNNGSISFKLPAGNSYTVTELDGSDYTVSTSTVTNGAVAVSGTSSAVTATVGENANTVAYTNDKSSSPLTGIVNNYGGLIAIVAIAAGGMIVLALRRRMA